MSDLQTLESAVLAAGPDDAPAVAAMLQTGPIAAPDQEPEGFEDLAEAAPEILPPEIFAEQWASIHDMLGGIVQARTGNPCPLGDQSRSAGGMMAAQATYNLLASTPALARLFLSPQSTFIGQIMIIGAHGFACVQIVKAANNPPPEVQTE